MPPYQVRLDHSAALRLAENGATLLILEVPERSVVLVDHQSYVVGPRFQGVKLLSPGAHFIGYSAVSKHGEVSPVTWFFLHLVTRQVVVRRWDTGTELILPLLDEDEVIRYSHGVRRFDFDGSLAPYNLEELQHWKSLSGHISAGLIQRLAPAGSGQSSIAVEADPHSGAPQTAAEQRLTEQLQEGAQAQPGSAAGTSHPTLSQPETRPDSRTFVGQTHYTPVPRLIKEPGHSGQELTQLNMDKSPLLQAFLSKRSAPSELMGELQYAFIAFLMGQSLEGFMQWKALLQMTLGSSAAVAAHADLFLQPLLTGFRDELPNGLAAQTKERMEVILQEISGLLGWQYDTHPDSDDEYAPVVDVQERRVLITQIYRLFSARQRAGATQEWNDKLPDFVRRLEEALYRTARSKEEYVDTNTLEHRLQHVARRMVSTQGNRRPEPGRPPAGQLLPQSNGFGGANSVPTASAYNGGAGFGSGGPINQLLGQPARSLPQNGSLPESSTSGMQQAPATGLTAGVPNGFAGAPGSNGARGVASPQLSNGPMSSPLALKPDLAAMGGMQCCRRNLGGLQPASGLLQTPSLGPGGQPVMSNGAPVLLRGGARDWSTPAPSPNLMSTGRLQPEQPGARLPFPGANGPGAGGMQPGQGLPNGQAGPGTFPHLGNGMIPNPSTTPHATAMQGLVPVGNPPTLNGLSPLAQASPMNSQGNGLLDAANVGAMRGGDMDGMASNGGAAAMPPADPACTYPRCVVSRELLKHHQKCLDPQCEVCTPVKNYVQKQRQMQMRQQEQLRRNQAAMSLGNGPPVAAPAGAGYPGAAGFPGGVPGQARPAYTPAQIQALQAHAARHGSAPMNGVLGMKRNSGHMMGLPNGNTMPGVPDYSGKRARKVVSDDNCGTSLVEVFSVEQIEAHIQRLRISDASGDASGYAGGRNAMAVAANHGLLPNGLLAPNVPNIADENNCSMCGLMRLTFEPPAVYCTSCAQRIKRNHAYYTTPTAKSEVKGYWCHGCYSDRGDYIEMEGSRVRKVELEKKKNDEETEEGWVQCDQCDRWVHQICGLFNKGRNTENTNYLCPTCLLHGLKSGHRKAITMRPQAMLEARDLPKNDLSEHLERELARVLHDDHLKRAEQQGLDPSKVPTVDGLCVRVINNVKKRTEVKPKFAEAFQHENYPSEFPYTQKVILLFQCIDGVDTCLYALYMQEYGDDAAAPNRKWVYLSYLDSIKYMRPENLESSRPRMALRTLVYHQIIISYLHYIRARGYTSMFIWACPPLQGDDYILYCHPSRQKTPRSDRLREWYLALLRVAKEQGAVTHLSNLCDTFFEGGRDHRDRASAGLMPYFEGDYWPGEAESALADISENDRKAGKKAKGKGGSGISAPRTKAKGKRYGAEPATADEALMARLGEVIHTMREDFIVVHLREPCSLCRAYIDGGCRYYHPAPPSRSVKQERTFEGISLDSPGISTKQVTSLQRFQICPSCYQNESAGLEGGKARGLPAGIQLSQLRPDPVEHIPATTDVGNPDQSSEFFDTRQAFLSLCQGNHFQFDTLRRAKHSSMMVLYHLHNPEAPAFSSSCNSCGMDIEPGAGYRCSVCSDFDICAACYQKGFQHPHPLHLSGARLDETRVRLTDTERADRHRGLRSVQAHVEPAAAACQDLPGHGVPRAPLPRTAGDAATADRALGGPAPRGLPEDAAEPGCGRGLLPRPLRIPGPGWWRHGRWRKHARRLSIGHAVTDAQLSIPVQVQPGCNELSCRCGKILVIVTLTIEVLAWSAAREGV
ncbi:hypothetical protein WJX73_009793 [Symbiochloris irregularis]|uniref:histone acetyltransferase n=1 Tax=Symbiochloris irregularis TaxID=706552 RepID=A0AAW1PF19_9CHLO